MTPKEYGFLFSDDMARALHYTPSPKTQTRRLPSPTMILVNGQGISSKRWNSMGIDIDRVSAITAEGRSVQAPWFNPETGKTETAEITPRVQAGDTIWSREAFAHCYKGNAEPATRKPHDVAYRAGGFTVDRYTHGLWTTALHMPRWAARYAARVTSVRFERLQSISHDDALAEGVECWRSGWDTKSAATAFLQGHQAANATGNASVPVRLYYMLWEQINGRGSWDSNPIVLAYSFEPIATPEKAAAS